MNVTCTLSGHALRLDLIRALAPTMRAIACSLGPNGRAGLYSVGGGARRAVNGTDIARRFAGDSPPERLFREAMVAAERDLGDGTARLAVMAEAALRTGIRMIVAGIHPSLLIHEVNSLRAELDMHFAAVTRVDENLIGVLRAASMSELAEARLREALLISGSDGHIELTQVSERGLRLEDVEGFTVEMEPLLSGVLGHMDQIHLLVANDIISDFHSLAPVIEGFARSNKALVIAARGLEGPAREFLERNRTAGILRVAAMTPTDKGPRAADILQDLACATGASMVSEETGQTLAKLSPGMLGSAKSFHRTRTRVVLTQPGGRPEEVAMRLKEIEGDIQRHRFLALDREHAQRRHARMSGRWVEIFVGEDRSDPDLFGQLGRALASARSAQVSGIIDGAGFGHASVAARIEDNSSGSGSETAARNVVAAALRAPGRCLRRNAGLEVLDGILPLDGLADPARLSRDALDIALSFALQLVSLETAILRNDQRNTPSEEIR